MWTRRQLLVGAGAAGLLVALGGARVAMRPTMLRTPGRPLLALDVASFSVLAAAAEVICPAVPGAPGPTELGVAEDVDAFLATCDPSVVDEVIQALAFVENALPALVLDGEMRLAFSACSLDDRARAFAAFRSSRIPLRRTVYKALLGLVGATYFGN
ncbi:MAG: hypothetical protein KC656_24880, partial [Myxococcales bacterium]|nr:hypothetical protein [Myxococcales bacterium]